MKKEIYINESMGENRIAILEDDKLVELYLEKQRQQRPIPACRSTSTRQ